jgi:hypothetical protein
LAVSCGAVLLAIFLWREHTAKMETNEEKSAARSVVTSGTDAAVQR